jgi:hypothetical protein
MTPLTTLAFYGVGVLTGALWTLAFMRAKVARMARAVADAEVARNAAMRATDPNRAAQLCEMESAAVDRFCKECR